MNWRRKTAGLLQLLPDDLTLIQEVLQRTSQLHWMSTIQLLKFDVCSPLNNFPNYTALPRFPSMSQWQQTRVWRTRLSLSEHWGLETHWQWAYLPTVSVNVKMQVAVSTHTAATREQSAVVPAGKPRPPSACPCRWVCRVDDDCCA